VAAALRHYAPRLLEGLREAARKSSKHSRDQELTSIRIEVQVAIPAPKKRVLPRGEMPVERLAKLAAKLSDSPLKDTLERISEPDHSKRTRSKI
jgi:hypothetical protein